MMMMNNALGAKLFSRMIMSINKWWKKVLLLNNFQEIDSIALKNPWVKS
jgi:hypothetical protein